MSRLADVLQWVTRSRLLKEAAGRSPASTSWSRTCLQRASACIALADTARQPAVPEDLRLPEALGLYRTACAWLLSAPNGEARPMAPLIDGTLTEQESAACKPLLLRDAFADGSADPDRLAIEAAALHALCLRLFADLQGPANELRRLRRQRWTRIVLILAALFAIVFGAQWGIRRALSGPNLSAGKPWRTSSAWMVCDPAHHSCGGTTDIFFHTKEEEQPWFEVDLLSPTSVHRVEILNRRDCCEERAVPLVVEVSDNRTQWREVARRSETFSTWNATFPKTTARFVRLRSLKRTALHLEGVSVYR